MSIRVLHVTESMASGVLSLVDSISRRQAEAGADVEVLYLVRSDTPAEDVIRARFDSRVRLTRIPPGGKRRDLTALYAALRKVYRNGDADVVHLHSSYAGMIGRVAARAGRTRSTVVYSPHGFGFLRLDLPQPVRTGVRWVERVLAQRGGSVLTSPSEFEIARQELKPRHPFLLQTGVPSESITALPTASKRESSRPLVGMIGRVTYQKAPWRFAQIARELSDLADFVWIGSGDEADQERWLADSPVTVTGRDVAA